MSSIMEHLVLFKVKDDVAASEINAMLDRINSLVSLDQLLHLTTGPLLRFQIQSSTSFSLIFTHFLHCRYKSKHDFHAYTVHPSHVAVVKVNSPLVDDAMALDFVAEDLQGGLVLPPCSAMRVTFFKLKEGLGDHVKDEVLGAIRAIQHEFKQAKAIQLTCGENFSPGRAKGFSIAALAVFPGLTELETVDSNEELGNYQNNDVIKEHLESAMVFDYVLPSPKVQSASSS